MDQPQTPSSKIVGFFLGNTRVAFTTFLILFFGGIFALISLRSEGFPTPSPEVAIITAPYPGASAEVVEQNLLKPIEESLSSVEGISEIRSTAQSGFGSVQVVFDVDIDRKAALSEVRAAVQGSVLPEGVLDPEVISPEFGGASVFLALTSRNGDPLAVREDAERLRRDFETVEGIEFFRPAAGTEYTDSVEVSVNAVSLAQQGISFRAVQEALSSAGFAFPAGTILNEGRVASVVTDAATNADTLSSLIVGINPQTNTPVALATVAEVSDIIATTKSLVTSVGSKSSGETSALPTIEAALIYELRYQKDVSVLDRAPTVYEVIDRNRDLMLKNGNSIVILSDVAVSIQDQVKEITSGITGAPIGDGPLRNFGYLFGGLWLIIIFMILFVNARSALLAAIAIPVTLLITLLALLIQGISLNTLTLFSMVLVLGLIVDPAIVALEAIQRQLDLGKKRSEAVFAAIDTVGSGLFFAVLTGVIVFIPFGVVSGTFGEIIRFIPATVIPALIASYIVSLVLIPFLGVFILRPSKKESQPDSIDSLWYVGKLFIRMNTYILSPVRWRGLLRFSIVFGLLSISLGVTGWLFATSRVSPVQFSSPEDSALLQVSVDFPANIPQSEKKELAQRIQDALARKSEVLKFYPGEQTDKSVSIRAELLPRSERERSSEPLAKELKNELATLNNPSLNIYYTISPLSVGPPEDQFPVAVNIYGDDLEVLKRAALATGDVLRARSDVIRVDDGFTNAKTPQVSVRFNREKLVQAGISPTQAAFALAGVVGKQKVATLEADIAGAKRPVEIMLLSGDGTTTPDSIGAIIVGVGSRGPVSLSDVADIGTSEGVPAISRLDGQRYITVRAQVEDPIRGASAPQQAVLDYWNSDKLQEFGLRSDALQNRGAGNQFLESFRELFVGLGVAFLLLYIVLVLFLRSFSEPIVILFAIPLSFLGVFPALTLVGGQFGFLEILGIIALWGTVVNVSIFLLDQANQKRAEGQAPAQAIAEATGIRFRPIFLTTATTVFGLLPLIMFAPFWRSLATVVSSGIIVSGILSLVVAPILYIWIITVKQKISSFRQRGRKN